MTGIIILLILLVVVGLLVFLSLPQFRVPLRHRLHDARERRVGELVWSEIVHERQAQGQDGRRGTNGSDLAGLITLNSTIRSGGFWPHRNRGVVSWVWLRHADGSVHLYAGVSGNHYGDGSAIKAAAHSIRARAVRMDTPPDVPTEAVAFARRVRPQLSSFQDRIESSGQLADAISGAMANLPAGQRAAVVITGDPMYTGETRRMIADIIESETIHSGDAVMHGGTATRAGAMVDGALRVRIAATVQSTNAEAARGLLGSALGGITSLAWQADIKTTTGDRLLPAMRARLADGDVVVPPFVWFNLRWYAQGGFRSSRREMGSDKRVGGRTSPPSSKDVMYLHPLALYQAVSFPEHFSAQGVDVHNDATLSRGLPSGMLGVNNPIYWGRSGTGQVICQDIMDLNFPFFTAGSPGSGKTNMLQVQFAGVIKAGLDKTAGLQITPMWCETKGQGAYDAWDMARRNNRAVFIDTHNPEATHRLALEGRRLADGATVQEVVQNISNLVSGFQFAWGDGIRASSREILDHSLRIAMLLSPEEIAQLELDDRVDPLRPNIVELAFYLLGGDINLQPGAKLLRFPDEAQRAGTYMGDATMRARALCDSIGQISRYLDPKSRKNNEQSLSSPFNKLAELRNAPLAWTPNRRTDIAVAQLPGWFAPVVLNMGPYRLPDGQFTAMQGAVSRRLMLMTTYLLWDRIKASCGGWEGAGKRVIPFADEVADIAVNAQSEDVINVLADANKEGRSRGTAFYVGCQSPDQMPFQAKRSVLASRNKFWFDLQEANDLRMAVDDLASGDKRDQPYTADNVRTLPRGTTVGIMKRGDTVSPPFTLKVPRADIWADLLLRPGVSVEDAIVAYDEWEQRQAHAERAGAVPVSPVVETPASDDDWLSRYGAAR